MPNNIDVERKNFGLILKGLRNELGKTQDDVAEWLSFELNTNNSRSFTAKFISKLENGNVGKIEPDLVEALANFFQFTSHERVQFFACAMGVTTWSGAEFQIESPRTAEDCLRTAREQIKLQTLYPSYVVDMYFNIIYANPAFLGFFNITPNYIERANKKPYPFNYINMRFSDDPDMRERVLVQEERDRLFLRHIYLYKVFNLRYRHTLYFKNLHTYLKGKLRSSYSKYWKRSIYPSNMLSAQASIDGFTTRSYLDQALSKEPLIYTTSIASIFCPQGDLYVITLYACDENTQAAFKKAKMRSFFSDVQKLSDWAKLDD